MNIVTVYRPVRRAIEANPAGGIFRVTICEVVELTPTLVDATSETETVSGKVHVDPDGNYYVCTLPENWGESPKWRRADGSGDYYTSVHGMARGLDGRALTSVTPAVATPVETITAYREVRRDKETCSYGCPHDVNVYETVEIAPTGEKRPYDDGYEIRDTELYVDADGNSYQRGTSIDFHGGSFVVRDSGAKKVRFDLSVRSHLARDVEGRPLTSETPALS